MTSNNPTIVLIHGGQHSKSCWQPTVQAMLRQQPNISVLAVDLPGHGDEPGDLAELTIAHCVDSVVAKIRAAKIESVVLVGHSMAGITVPGVAIKLGNVVVKKMVFVACCIPPNGKAVIDTLQHPMKFFARRAAGKKLVSPPLAPSIAAWVFGNGMTSAQKSFMVNSLCAESCRIVTETVDRSRLPKIPTSWILTLRDRALRPSLQRKFIVNLGSVEEVVEFDTCHDAMISEPEKLANILLRQAGYRSIDNAAEKFIDQREVAKFS